MTRDVRRMIGRSLFGLALALSVLASASCAWWVFTVVAHPAASTPCPDGPYRPEDSDARAPMVIGDREAGPDETIRLAKGCRQWADVTVVLTGDARQLRGEIRFVALAPGESGLTGPPALRFGSDDFVVCPGVALTEAACRSLTEAATFEERVPRGSAKVATFVLDPAGARTVTIAYRPMLSLPPDTAGKYCEDPFSFCVLLPSRWRAVSSPVFLVTTRVESAPADPGTTSGG